MRLKMKIYLIIQRISLYFVLADIRLYQKLFHFTPNNYVLRSNSASHVILASLASLANCVSKAALVWKEPKARE